MNASQKEEIERKAARYLREAESAMYDEEYDYALARIEKAKDQIEYLLEKSK